MASSTLGLPQHHKLALYTSTTTCAFILGSTTWASFAVMPSLIAAPISTYAKLSVFRGLIIRANSILPPIFILASSSLGYLTYHARDSHRMRFGLGLGAMVASLALQGVIVPKNAVMVRIVEEGRGKDDEGVECEGNRRIGELWWLNLVRVVCGGVAFGVSLVELGRHL